MTLPLALCLLLFAQSGPDPRQTVTGHTGLRPIPQGNREPNVKRFWVVTSVARLLERCPPPSRNANVEGGHVQRSKGAVSVFLFWKVGIGRGPCYCLL